MKRPFLILLAIAASIGFGTWLVRTPNSEREIWLACAGWVLGFWVAAAIQGRRRRDDRDDDAAEPLDDAEGDDDGWDEAEEEDWDDAEDEDGR